mmetsp:Transcript_53854/g.149796  ORF Transcript_53854/g.149796 Transcript_53854/m.149796 type:complete len:276 (+) Transcript_53854:78-905(+)
MRVAAGGIALLMIRLVAVVGQREEPVEEKIETDRIKIEEATKVHANADTNSDGKVSLQEILEYSMVMRKAAAGRGDHAAVEELDANRDGKLSLEEVLKDIGTWADDADNEEKKSAEALRAVESEKFRVADGDADGYLSREELAAMFYPEIHDGVLAITAAASLREKDRDGDGELTQREFWEGDVSDDEDLTISEEETKDFNALDKDGNGRVNLEELKAWESGMFHTEEAMKNLFEICDKDGDMHVTLKELHDSWEEIDGTDVRYHLMEWAWHDEL